MGYESICVGRGLHENKMKTYPTSYECAGHRYASYVRASTRQVAVKRMLMRGLGERIDRRSPGDKQRRCSAYDLFTDHKFMECLHWLCFAGNVLCNAGLWTTENLLGDNGLIHRVIHLQGYDKKARKRYREWINGERGITLLMLMEFDKRTAKLGY